MSVIVSGFRFDAGLQKKEMPGSEFRAGQAEQTVCESSTDRAASAKSAHIRFGYGEPSDCLQHYQSSGRSGAFPNRRLRPRYPPECLSARGQS
jgi:hypothetical protein